MPGSPARNVTRRSLASDAFHASIRAFHSGARPASGRAMSGFSRSGRATAPSICMGSQHTRTDGTGSGTPRSSRSPIASKEWLLLRAIIDTSSVVMICPASHFAHSRDASTTGSPK